MNTIRYNYREEKSQGKHLWDLIQEVGQPVMRGGRRQDIKKAHVKKNLPKSVHQRVLRCYVLHSI